MRNLYHLLFNVKKKGLICCFILFFVITSVFATAVKSVDIKMPTKNMRSITALLTRLVVTQHYEGKPITEERSAVIFQDYLKKIDPLKMYFMQSDIERFSVNRYILGQQLLKGDTQFAFTAFNLLLARMKEYQSFAQSFLKTNPVLETQEDFLIDYDKAPWPLDEKEMHEHWRKKLLHELILLKIADKAAEEERTKEKDPKKRKKSENVKSPEERILKRIKQTVRFYSDMDAPEILEIYLSTVTQSYDPHSSYMSPRSDEEFEIDMSLTLIGIGAVLTQEDGYTKIIEIIVGGPADKSGKLKEGDRIIAVQQENEEPVDVIDMPLNKVVRHIRGKENTWVTLTVIPAGKGLDHPEKISILRKKVEIKESAAKGKVHTWKGKRIGVIHLPSFYFDFEAAKRGLSNYRAASNDVKKILLDFRKQKVDGIVMDLRSNGGGSLREAIMLTGLFISEGPVVQVKDKRNVEVQNDEDDGEIVYDGPLAVMTNRFSASSSEIFAAAIRDYGRGIITGDKKTHGKGTVQIVADLDRYMPYLTGRRFKAGAIRLTNAKFYRINGATTQLQGVAADIPFPAVTDLMDIGEDKLDHPLSWDTIPATKYQTYTGKYKLDDARRKELKERSEKRRASNPEYQALQKSLAEYAKIKDRKTLKLNFTERWQEYKKQKKIREEEEALFKLKSSKKENKGNKDLYLNETMNVLLDLIQLAEQSQS
ncbi:MAG: carboxy terminal-processing peptidase [Lentisphaeria bacterium]|nr:carboxy terminal-processing peptidase [Lentisphaeria bacterium]